MFRGVAKTLTSEMESFVKIINAFSPVVTKHFILDVCGGTDYAFNVILITKSLKVPACYKKCTVYGSDIM